MNKLLPFGLTGLVAYGICLCFPSRRTTPVAPPMPPCDLTYTSSYTVHAPDLLRDAKEYGCMTQLVSVLLTSGEFCRVRGGHDWVTNKTFTYITVYHDYDATSTPCTNGWRGCFCGAKEALTRNVPVDFH